MPEKVIFDPINKAINSLERALQQPKNEFTRDATIQRFEYTYELAWKLLKRSLKEYYGVDEGNIKNLYRLAYKNKLIKDLEPWFQYHSARNLTVHTYNENMANETYIYAKAFLKDVIVLTKTLEDIVNAA